MSFYPHAYYYYFKKENIYKEKNKNKNIE